MPQRDAHCHATQNHLGADEKLKIVDKIFVLYDRHAQFRLAGYFIDELVPIAVIRCGRYPVHF